MTDNSGFTVVSTNTVVDLGFLRVDVANVATPSGDTVERVVVVHPGAVAVVALDGDDIILIAQYRAAVDATVIEIPAGKLDKAGEDRVSAAARELEEETGFVPDELIHLTDLKTGVGFTNEEISIYLARSVTRGTMKPVGEEEAAANVYTIPFSQAVEDVENGIITDAKTVVGILLVEHLGGPS